MKNKTQSKALVALTSSALLLPGISPLVVADTAPDKTTVGLRVSTYQEDDIRTEAGNFERYEVDVNQFHLLAPVADNYSLQVDLQHETMSGASPWFVGRDANDQPVTIMSGASISDERTDVIVSGRVYEGWGNAAIKIAASEEDDYSSRSIAADAAYNLENNLMTINGAISYSDDEIEPTQSEVIVPNTLKDDKQTWSLFFGGSQIINKTSVIHSGLSFTRHSGYLSDPYKKNDRRPDTRGQLAWTTQWRQYLESANGALHADYRFYADSWSVLSHTFELAFYHNTLPYLQLVPQLRYYSQKEADFFRNAEDQDGRHHSSDYRLSTYGAYTAGLKAIVSINAVDLMISGERYRSSGKYSIWSGEESPALVDYALWTLGVDYSF